MNGWLRSIPPRLARAPRTAARPLLPFETLLLRCDVEEVLRALVRFFSFLVFLFPCVYLNSQHILIELFGHNFSYYFSRHTPPAIFIA